MAIEISCYKMADLISGSAAARTNELEEIKRAVKRLEATIAKSSSENVNTQASDVRNNEDILETHADEDELTELLRGDDAHGVSEDDESLLAEIYEGMGEQRASDPVTDRLAKIVEKKCSAPVLGPEDARAAIEKFPRPGNKGRPAGSVSFLLLIRAYKQVSPPMLEDGREPIPHLGSANASVQAGAHSLDSFRAGGLGQGKK